VGTVKSFGQPHSIESSHVGGGIVVLFAIPAMTFSTHYNCWELSRDG